MTSIRTLVAALPCVLICTTACGSDDSEASKACAPGPYFSAHLVSLAPDLEALLTDDDCEQSTVSTSTRFPAQPQVG